ncbi:MAG: hypothetical protein Q9170_001307 [Blastenia crenularia]
MYNWLSPPKPRKSHTRSQSTPYLQRSQTSSFATESFSDGYNHENDSPHDQELPKPPTLTHQPTSAVQTARQLPPLITQDPRPTQPARPTSKIADWFSGESEPITFAIIPSPTKEKSDSVVTMPSASEQSPVQTQNTPKPPIISRFSLFGTKPALSKTPTTPSDVHDEWHELDVRSALIPSGSADPFSPSAFKNLQQNAEGLLTKLQTAYKQRSEALHDVLAEKEAQAEELQGAEMHTKHLKLQLDDLTTKLAEQDKAMMDLVDQLAHEKQARRALEDSIVHEDQAEVMKPNNKGHSEDSRPTERIWKSRTSTASDLSVGSEDSSAESLFSWQGATSPTMSMSSVSTVNSPESQQQHQLPIATNRPRGQAGLIGGPFSGLRSRASKIKATEAPYPTACASCKRLGNSEAWDLVGVLKLENQGLKSRLGQLESTVDDCLDMVQGLF